MGAALHIAAWIALWAGEAAAQTAPPAHERLPVLSAAFALETTDAAEVERSAGTLAFLPGGDVCVWVTTPLRQEMRLGARELVIYYPDRDLAMVGNVSPGKAPPVLESIVAGVSDPGASLGAGSKLVEQRRADGRLLTRWHVEDGAGHELGELRAVEERAGTASLEIYDRKGKLQRRFSFADRARVGGRSVPRAIEADFFAADGSRRRHERWTLRDVAPLDGAHRALPDCARRRPTTKVQELPWGGRGAPPVWPWRSRCWRAARSRRATTRRGACGIRRRRLPSCCRRPRPTPGRRRPPTGTAR